MKTLINETVSSNKEYDPDFCTFPMEDVITREKDSDVGIPSEDDINECKDWVDFKEM